MSMVPDGDRGELTGPVLSDIAAIRQRARQHIEQGAVTPGYRANKQVIVDLLNEALATELVCVLRYRRHYFMAQGIAAEAIKKEFLVHAQEEQGHADEIAKRIVELGGEPNFNPDELSARSHSQYVAGKDLADMVVEDLIAERIAIESYREMIEYIGPRDSTTRRMLEGILAVEEQHADELSGILTDVQRGRADHPAMPRSGDEPAKHIEV